MSNELKKVLRGAERRLRRLSRKRAGAAVKRTYREAAAAVHSLTR